MYTDKFYGKTVLVILLHVMHMCSICNGRYACEQCMGSLSTLEIFRFLEIRKCIILTLENIA